MRNKKLNPILENVEVTGISAKGKAVAKVDGMVIFVQGAVPGDVVDVEVRRKKRKHKEGIVKRIVKPSMDRVEPFCEHFGTCGGCKWQDLDYEKQITLKQQQIEETLTRVGGLELPQVTPILPSPSLTHYRNKLEFTFSAMRWITEQEMRDGVMFDDKRALGFHVPGRFDRALELNECHLQPQPSDAIRAFTKDYAMKNGLTFYNIREHHGLLRTFMIRTTLTGEVMVVLACGEENEEQRVALLDAIINEFPQITSLQYVINEKKNDTIYDQNVILHHGRDHIIEELPTEAGPLRFRIGAKTFFQTNPEQTRVMYAKVMELAELSGNELVYDLYCGAGSISLFLAQKASRVVGVELVPESIEDAWENARLNTISNVHFVAGDMKDVLSEEFIQQQGKPDVMVVDPPRAGMHPKVVERIREVVPERLIYVSCDPATQARDLALLKDLYEIDHVQPIDMFPHTSHVENIVRCIKRT